MNSEVNRPHRTVEWPTVCIAVACHVGFFVSAGASDLVTLPLAMILLTLSLTLYSSLTHEVIHGHPFRHKMLNDALVFLAFGMLIPFQRFRDTHLAHHNDPSLTDPYDDPETNFVDPGVWNSWGTVRRGLYRFNNTLLGRVVIGPVIGLVTFYAADFKAMKKGDQAIRRAYVLHVIGWVPVLIWLLVYAQMPFWAYLICVYLSHSILKIRTFLEHRAHEVARCRSVIIEDKGPLAFLFLYNNLHAVHHARPGLPWYKLWSFYTARRTHFLKRNGGYFYRSYREIFLRYLIWAKDPVPHSLWPEPAGSGKPSDAPTEH